MEEFNFQWPTDIFVDLLSDRLLILDSDLVYRLDSRNSLRLVAGTPPHCELLTDARNRSLRQELLTGATAIAADLEGRVLVAESDGKRLHRIRVFDQDGRSQVVAGKESKCDCHPEQCPCYDDEYALARDAHLHGPVSLAVDPSGKVFVADQGNLKIRTIEAAQPLYNSQMRQYEIFAGDSQEIYVFNRFGQHMGTRSLLTGGYIYNFTYNVDTSYGRLIYVDGSGGHRLYLMRKSSLEVNIETSQGQKSVARVSPFSGNMLESLTGPDGAVTKFEYQSNSGLLTARLDPDGKISFYEYDVSGQAFSVVCHTGDVYRVDSDLNRKQLLARIRRNGQLATEYRSTDLQIDQTG